MAEHRARIARTCQILFAPCVVGRSRLAQAMLALMTFTMSACARPGRSAQWVVVYRPNGSEPWMPVISYDHQTLRRVGDTVFVRIRHDLPRAVPPVTDSTLRVDRIEQTELLDCRRTVMLRRLTAAYYLKGRPVVLGPFPAGAFVDTVVSGAGRAHDPIAEAVCRDAAGDIPRSGDA